MKRDELEKELEKTVRRFNRLSADEAKVYQIELARRLEANPAYIFGAESKAQRR